MSVLGVPVARVMFREAINLPGKTLPGNPPSYPMPDNIIVSCDCPGVLPDRLKRKDRFRLYLDAKYPSIIIERVDTGERNRAPMSVVKEYVLISDVEDAVRTREPANGQTRAAG